MTTEDILYATPIAGALAAIVFDHVVNGRVVFPAAGFCEMAREATANASTYASLQDVTFVKVLFVEDLGDLVYFRVKSASFDVSSTVQAAVAVDDSSEQAVHCRGRHDGTATDTINHLTHHTHHRALCEKPSPRSLYEYFTGSGCNADVVSSNSHGVVVRHKRIATLLPRNVRQRTHVHPADLDDALCLSALTLRHVTVLHGSHLDRRCRMKVSEATHATASRKGAGVTDIVLASRSASSKCRVTERDRRDQPGITLVTCTLSSGAQDQRQTRTRRE